MILTDPIAEDTRCCQPRWIWPRAAYIHVPFCAHHCGYCDFAVSVGHDSQIDAYVDALGLELARLGERLPVDTIFIGGGTPTYLDCWQLERLLSNVHRWLNLQPGGEFSIEANPGSLDAGKVSVLAEYGVNRVSLGAQSFHPHALQVLERDHVPSDVPRAVDAVKAKIEQVSLDLIFGVPGQSVADWQDDLQRALGLEPDHLSTYGLTFEKGTRLWKQRRQGLIQQLSEETELEMYRHSMSFLPASGFEHYEISNFARPGQRSRHNQVYWANHAYFGFGMGAARYINGRRETNTRNLTTYVQRINNGHDPAFQSEELPPTERAYETMSLNLRRCEGIDRAEFREQTGYELAELAGELIASLVEQGLLEDDGASVFLTNPGKCVADGVIEQIWRLNS